MTVKDLRKTTAYYIDVVIACDRRNEINISAENTAALEAFGSFVIESIDLRDGETIVATLKMQPVKE